MKIIKELQEFSEKFPVVVEGKNDKEVLEKLQVKNVYTVHEIGKVLCMRHKKVLLLVDNDKKGRKLYKKLVSIFESEDIKVEHILRLKFFKSFPRIRRIEDLKRWVRSWQDTWKELEQYALLML